jgi:hypothetical protein
MKPESEGYGWHFHNGKLRGGIEVPGVGIPLIHTGTVSICRSGLHLSLKPSQALQYAPGPYLTRVKYRGLVDYEANKLVCSERTILAQKDITDLLRFYARKQALTVAHLWDMPVVVREYLETGGEGLRSAAESAAKSAAKSAAEIAAWGAAEIAAWSAARSASKSADEIADWSVALSAAWSAAESAAESAAKSAAKSTDWSVALSAAWSAAESAAYGMFDDMVYKEFGVVFVR